MHAIDPKMTCTSFLKRQGVSLMIYAGDYDGRLPKGNWMDAAFLGGATECDLHCPEARWANVYGYSASSLILGKMTDDPQVAGGIWILDSTQPGRNQLGISELAGSTPAYWVK